MRRWPWVVSVVVVVAGACGGSGSTHALHARQVPHSVPPISVEVTTTTTTPPETAPPTITAATTPPNTAAPQPALDCLTVLNEVNATWQQKLGRNATKAELMQIVTGMGRTDCLAAVDSYQPPLNPGAIPHEFPPNYPTNPHSQPGCGQTPVSPPCAPG